MTVLVWLGLWVVASICLAIIWMALHAPRRRWPVSQNVEPDAVTECRLCGPTAAAIERSGFCWRCAPWVRKARADYRPNTAYDTTDIE